MRHRARRSGDHSRRRPQQHTVYIPLPPPPPQLAGAAARRSVAAAAVAAEAAAPANPYRQPAGKGMGFYTGEDGYLYCDNMRVDDIRAQVTVESDAPRRSAVCARGHASMRVHARGSVAPRAGAPARLQRRGAGHACGALGGAGGHVAAALPLGRQPGALQSPAPCTCTDCAPGLGKWGKLTTAL